MAVSVKDEPLSPLSCGVSGQTGNGSHATGLSLPQQVAEFHMPSPPAKRAKYEPESVPNQDQTKNRLKNVVIGRRRARGESDVENLFEEPRESPLTSLDIERRERRKEQNRKAAKKCRFKKREQETAAAEETARVDQVNKQLQITITEYQLVIHHLKYILHQHLTCGDCKLDQTLRDQHFYYLNNQHHQLPPATTNMAPTHQEPHHETLSELPQLRSTYTAPVISDNVSVAPFESEGNLNSIEILAYLGFGEGSMANPIPQEDLDALENTEIQTTKMSTEEIGYGDCLTEGQRQITSSDIPIELSRPSFTSHGNKTRIYYPGEGQDTGQPETPIDDLLCCVSPNAVQPTQLQTVPGVTAPDTTLAPFTSSHYNYNNNNGCVAEGHLLKYNTDINNNIGSETNIPFSRNNNSHMPQGEPQIHGTSSLIPHNGCRYTQNSVPTYFTFDSRSQSPEFAHATEPISPFYTQGGNRRL